MSSVVRLLLVRVEEPEELVKFGHFTNVLQAYAITLFSHTNTGDGLKHIELHFAMMLCLLPCTLCIVSRYASPQQLLVRRTSGAHTLVRCAYSQNTLIRCASSQ